MPGESGEETPTTYRDGKDYYVVLDGDGADCGTLRNADKALAVARSIHGRVLHVKRHGATRTTLQIADYSGGGFGSRVEDGIEK